LSGATVQLSDLGNAICDRGDATIEFESIELPGTGPRIHLRATELIKMARRIDTPVVATTTHENSASSAPRE
jgi:hypothetical protein